MNTRKAPADWAGYWMTAHGVSKGAALFFIVILLVQPAFAAGFHDSWTYRESATPTPSAPQKTSYQVMKEFGESLAKDNPDLASKSNREKGQFAFTRYCEALARSGAPVNANLWNRMQNLVRNGERGRWTCSDHTLNLQALFKGIGIDSADILNIQADSESLLPTPNSDHGALVLFDDDGKPYIFDAWKLAVDNGGTYSGTYSPASSKWNGMDAAQWSVEMRTYPNSYTRFTCDSGMTWDLYAADAIERYKGVRKVSTSTTVAAATTRAAAGNHPVITKFSGPDASTISSVVKHDFSQVSFTYSLDVTGGSPPYTYTWMGDGYKVLYEGTQFATVTIPTSNLRFNGQGFAVYLTVKDSAGMYAVGKDPGSGVMTSNLAYYIDAGDGTVQKLPDV